MQRVTGASRYDTYVRLLEQFNNESMGFAQKANVGKYYLSVAKIMRILPGVLCLAAMYMMHARDKDKPMSTALMCFILFAGIIGPSRVVDNVLDYAQRCFLQTLYADYSRVKSSLDEAIKILDAICQDQSWRQKLGGELVRLHDAQARMPVFKEFSSQTQLSLAKKAVDKGYFRAGDSLDSILVLFSENRRDTELATLTVTPSLGRQPS